MNWLRTILRIPHIQQDLQQLVIENQAIGTQLREIRKTLNTIGPGLGRVIAKLDPQYGRSEFDPARKAESDKLAEETIKRLEAEAAARAPYNKT